jgi:regulator of protease activity HflC (stomatin/prohibitin superfamily)
VLAITSIVLLAVSFQTIEPTEFGLAINGNTQTIDPSVRSGGRHFLGLGWYFVKFPNTVIAVRFVSEDKAALPVRSSDGLTITLDVSFEYKLIQTELTQLYLKFTENIEDPISKVAREAVRVAASRFGATNFFSSRNNVSLSMFNELELRLANVHCQLNSFQLLNIKLPDKFDNAIQQTEVTRQQIATANQQQIQALIEAETQVQAAVQQATVIRTKADTEANATIVQGTAEASTIIARANNTVQGYLTVQTAAAFTPGELLAYAWIQALASTQAKLTFNVQKPQEVVI